MEFSCKKVVLGTQMSENLEFQFASRLRARELLQPMQNFTKSDSLRVGVLYGLRRTGKSILLMQWLWNLPYEEREKSAYIEVNKEQMLDVEHDLEVLRDHGYKYIAVDEITVCEDFIDSSSILSENFAKSGMKLYIAGTDSLSIWFALNDRLYDRDATLHTTHVSYAEWARLTQQDNLDEYIRRGGLLHLHPTFGELHHGHKLSWTAKDAHNYFNSAIARNIQNSIRRYDEGITAGLLEPLLEDPSMNTAMYGLFGNLTRNEFIGILDSLSNVDRSSVLSALQSSIGHDSHRFSANIMAKKFKSSDLLRTTKAFKDKNRKLYYVTKDLLKELREQVEQLLEVRSKIGKPIDDAQYIELEKYMHALEVFARRPGQAFLPLNPTEDDFIRYRKIDELLRSQNIVVQPGLRYAQADIVLGLIEQSPRFRVLSDNDKHDLIKTYQDGVLGV
ncbi:MAG: AAA family ATPase, partial [Desulfovibrionaceae bacterium]|nr:AAA family ATPase [Desulfovibrionaceae bacterium]